MLLRGMSDDAGNITSPGYCHGAELVGVVMRAMLRRSTDNSCDAVGHSEKSTEDAHLEDGNAATHDYKTLQLGRVTALVILPVESRKDNRTIQKLGRSVIYELFPKFPMVLIWAIPHASHLHSTLECTSMHEEQTPPARRASSWSVIVWQGENK